MFLNFFCIFFGFCLCCCYFFVLFLFFYLFFSDFGFDYSFHCPLPRFFSPSFFLLLFLLVCGIFFILRFLCFYIRDYAVVWIVIPPSVKEKKCYFIFIIYCFFHYFFLSSLSSSSFCCFLSAIILASYHIWSHIVRLCICHCLLIFSLLYFFCDCSIFFYSSIYIFLLYVNYYLFLSHPHKHACIL